MEPTMMDRPVQPGGASAFTPDTPTGKDVALAAMRAADAAADTAKQLKLLSKADLFSNRPRQTTEVVIEGHGRARIASLRQGQWEDLNARHQGPDGKTDTSKGYMAEAVAAGLCEPDGTPMFEDIV